MFEISVFGVISRRVVVVSASISAQYPSGSSPVNEVVMGIVLVTRVSICTSPSLRNGLHRAEAADTVA
jgi:hypothetical protein